MGFVRINFAEFAFTVYFRCFCAVHTAQLLGHCSFLFFFSSARFNAKLFRILLRSRRISLYLFYWLTMRQKHFCTIADNEPTLIHSLPPFTSPRHAFRKKIPLFDKFLFASNLNTTYLGFVGCRTFHADGTVELFFSFLHSVRKVGFFFLPLRFGNFVCFVCSRWFSCVEIRTRTHSMRCSKRWAPRKALRTNKQKKSQSEKHK